MGIGNDEHGKVPKGENLKKEKKIIWLVNNNELTQD